MVVGGGAVGVACAYELARRGARVTLLESEPELGLGCSYGNAGLVGSEVATPLATPTALREGMRWLFAPDAPFHAPLRPRLLPWMLRFALASRRSRSAAAARALLPLGRDSYRMHLEYAAAGLEVGLRQRGALLTWETERGFAAGGPAHAQEGTLLSGDEARRAAPGLAPRIAGAVYVDAVAHCDSLLWTRGVGAAAAGLGAELAPGTAVRGLLVEGGRVSGVETEAGPLRAGVVVLAAGVWSRALLRPLGISLPLEAGKGYHVDVDTAAGDPSLPVYMQESHVVATPLGRCLRLAGTLELSGLDASISTRRSDAVAAAAARTLPGIGGRRRQEVWAGLRPCTADGIPVIGR
ncbi:MAG: FAD-dependent oxidoreductase, partial [Chloroflexota bacterium]